MARFNQTLNAGMMLALHLADKAVRTHLKAEEVIWSNMEVYEHSDLLPGWRQFSFGRGLVHVPGTDTTVWCVVEVRLQQDGDGWIGNFMCVHCTTPKGSASELPEHIPMIQFYYCEGSQWKNSNGRDIMLPACSSRFPISA